MPEEIRIEIAPGERIGALVHPAAAAGRLGVTLILAHGAGAGRSSPFMVSFARALAARGIDIVTFNFPYMEAGRRLPDRNDRLEACYRTVVEAVRGHGTLCGQKLAIGGKSMGGRIASQIAAAGAGDLAGLVFLGYPLHPPGKPERLRAAHLPLIKVPMLFVQGARDTFGTPAELRPILAGLTVETRLYVVEGGDHSFKVPKSAGIAQSEVYGAIQNEIGSWLAARCRPE